MGMLAMAAGRQDRLARAIIAGFVAATVMLFTFILAYLIASLLGTIELEESKRGAIAIREWFNALTNNPLIDLARPNPYLAVLVHFIIGIVFAVVYAYLFEPRLTGPGWQRGVIFSLVPWVLSLVVFLPAIGGGFLGLGIGAGPLPIIGNLVLHLTYGATLGTLYGPAGRLVVGDEAPTELEGRVISRSDAVAAQGIVVGLGIGLIIGGAALLLGRVTGQQTVLGDNLLAATVAAAMTGAALGGLVGSFIGLTYAGEETTPARPG
jgi:hypothetical protein